MKKSIYNIALIFSLLLFMAPLTTNAQTKPDQKIFIYGGGFNRTFLNYIAELTGKETPKILFLPTASGDSDSSIIRWYEMNHGMDTDPYVQKVWISSYRQKKTFEEVLLSMDAIVVGGGNTLNMIAIWKAQGIDSVLAKARDQGIVLAGGSAGSLCWFEEGTTDSRPDHLTTVYGLGFLKYSHSPHYHSEEFRRPLYHEKILSEEYKEGYACDNSSGIVFVNGEADKVVAMDKEHNCYFVSKKGDEIDEIKLESEILTPYDSEE